MVGQDVIETVKLCRELSRAGWEQAIDTSRLGTSGAWAADGAACDEQYERALAFLEQAIGALESARDMEAAGGDDRYARRALAALQSAGPTE